MPESNLQGFVAMQFDERLEECYTGAIKPAIESAGYRPLRIDKTEHINKIDDEIIKQIDCSKFLIADLTNQRSNVFYEAGYAKGIGIPIFYTANLREKEKGLPFDVSHYNCIFWKDEDLEKFKLDLSIRIKTVLESFGEDDYAFLNQPIEINCILNLQNYIDHADIKRTVRMTMKDIFLSFAKCCVPDCSEDKLWESLKEKCNKSEPVADFLKGLKWFEKEDKKLHITNKDILKKTREFFCSNKIKLFHFEHVGNEQYRWSLTDKGGYIFQEFKNQTMKF